MAKYRGSSSGDGEQAEQAEQVRIEIPDKLVDMLMLLDDARMSEGPDQQQPTRPRIQEVPSALHDKEKLKRYYEPMVVAIGPVHSKKNINYYEKQARLENGEKVKLKLARQFIQENGIPRVAASMKIMSELQALKDCYQENALRPFSESDLAFMFLVDGCALLHFMVSIVDDNEDLLLHHVNYDFISFAKRDIFLLENQLPYRLLSLLISFIPQKRAGFLNNVGMGLGDEPFITLFTFIMSPVIGRFEIELQPQLQRQPQPLHLLDLLHRSLTFVPRSQKDLTGCWERTTFMACFNCSSQMKVVRSQQPARSKSCLRWLSTHRILDHYKQATFRSARELKSVGIGFNQSPTVSVTDVTFQQKILRGTLSLPSITVNDSTISMFLNLIAYEMCPDFKSNLEVTSYICFLDALIDCPDDVWLLRQSGIIRNHLGSDEDVAKLFNQMAMDLVPNPKIYRRTKSKMYKQHKNTGKIRIWLAEMEEKYFSNPWTFLAVCGAVFGLVLGFIQAWFAVKSYYHPKKA